MKTRSGYVSNSSSSSFIVAYDKSFYGDLVALIRGNKLGFETTAEEFPDEESVKGLIGEYFNEDDDEYAEKLEKCLANQAAGKTIAILSFNHNSEDIIKLLQQISDMNGGDKLVRIYGEPE